MRDFHYHGIAMKLLNTISPGWRHLAPLLATFSLIGNAAADESVALRAESFTRPPSTQPLGFVAIRNLQEVASEGNPTFKGPQGSRIAPAVRNVSLAPGETKRVPFTIERGTNVAIQQAPGRDLPLFGRYCAGEVGLIDTSEKKPGVLSGGAGWDVMFTVVAR